MDDNLNRPAHNRFQQEPLPLEVSSEGTVEHRRIIPENCIVDGKFRVIRMLGRGANGTVYQVEQMMLRQDFAMKVLDPVTLSDESWRRFQKEAQASARLDHPGFVKVHDFGMIDNTTPYFSMDLVPGETLAARLERTGPLKLKEAMPLFLQLCGALEYAHSKGIIHRDLKPSNVSISPSSVSASTAGGDQIKILDFGIAKLVGSDATAMTQAGSVFGTPFYMSPEQCMGDPVDQRSDIYSLGCMFFELLTGAPPFTTANPLTLMMQHQSERPLSLKEASMGVEFPKSLESIIQKMLAKSPNDRYQNLAVVSKDLMAVREGKSALPSDASNLTQSAELKGNAVLLFVSWVLAAVIIVLLGVIASLYAKNHNLAISIKNMAPAKVVAPAVDALVTKKYENSFIPRQRYFSDVKTLPNGVEERTFHFPTQWRLGMITKANGDFVANALGDYKTLARKGHPCINLTVNWLTIGVVPGLLAKFRPDEVGGLSFEFDERAKATGDLDDDRCFNDVFYYIRDYKQIYAITNLQPETTDEAIPYLKRLTTLKWLHIAGTKMTGERLSELPYLPTLKQLRAGRIIHAALMLPHFFAPHENTNQILDSLLMPNVDMTNKDLQYISRMEGLKELKISYNPKINDEGLKSISNLHLDSLAIAGCSITPKSIDTLKKMNIRKSLFIDLSRWSKADADSLRQAIAPCKINPPELASPTPREQRLAKVGDEAEKR